jgi:p-methyltransferase
MGNQRMIDCLVIGINEQSFDSYVKGQATFKDYSGSYGEIFTNSIFVDDTYFTSIELMSWLLNQVDSKKWNLNVFDTPNLGVYYLTNFLRKRNINTKFVNHFNSETLNLDEVIQSGTKCVVITTTFYVSDDPIIEIIHHIRAIDTVVPIIVGGPRIYEVCSAYPQSKRNIFLNRIGANYYIVDSQGEATLRSLVLALMNDVRSGIPDIPNLVYKVGKEFISTIRNPESNSLDDNILDWNLFSPQEYGKTVYMRTARGCQYSCSYCTYPKFAGKHECSSIASVEREMDQLFANGVKYIIFIDDSFNVPLKRFKSICEIMIQKKYNFKWLSFFRCAKTDDSLVNLMKQSGCMGVYLGVESLNQSVLMNMKKGGLDYISCVSLFEKYNIMTLGSFIVGFPGETEESVKETIRIFNKYPTTFYNPQLYYHSLFAPINERAKEFALKGHGYAWSHSSMDWKEAIFWKTYMIRSVTSILLPLYSSGIWALPYLMEQGITVEFFLEYTRFISNLIIDGMNGAFKTKKEILQDFKRFSTLSDVIRGEILVC